MFRQELGEEVCINAIGILQRVGGGELSCKAEAQRGIAERQIEVNKDGALLALLHEGHGEVTCDGRNSRSTLAAEEDEQFAAGFFGCGFTATPTHAGAHEGYYRIGLVAV